jgi:hypothetical protein
VFVLGVIGENIEPMNATPKQISMDNLLEGSETFSRAGPSLIKQRGKSLCRLCTNTHH